MKMNVVISREEYRNLLISQLKLELLEEGGVNNWEGYEYSLHPDGEADFWERAEEIENEYA